MTDTMSARWAVMETDAATSLRITLWNGHGFTLLYPHDGRPPWTCLWAPGSEHELDQTTPQDFKQWLDGAQGRRAR